ncbi:MFS transporter [Streptomyces tendae]|uniref:MFS transporter n=1 Tax=Streptomyces tendae TaxID=1932 RepID=UPI0033F4DD25
MSSALDEAAAPPAPDPHRWRALAVLLTASFLDLIDSTIVNIALPKIRADIDASFADIQWITGGYTLTFAIGLITGGRLGDIFGRKRLFLIGVGGFTIASALCAVAGGPEMLITARVLQGAMASLMVPQVLSIIHVTFPAEERGKVFGMVGAIFGIGAVAGPLIGAVLTEWNLFGLEWRPIFLINLPIGIAGVLIGLRVINDSRATDALRLDLVGVFLAAATMLALLYPLTQGRELGWPAWSFGCLAGSLVLVVVFVLYQRSRLRRGRSALVELPLFRLKSFAGGIALQLTFSVSFGIFGLVGALYLQIGLGWSPLRAGLVTVPLSIAVALLAGRSIKSFVPKYGRKVLQAGALIMLVGALLYLWEARHFGTDIQAWHVLLAMAVVGVGMGLIVAPLSSAILSEVPFSHAGSASGLVTTTMQLGTAIGLGLTSLSFFRGLDGSVGRGPTADDYVDAFSTSLWWVVAGFAIVFLLVFALPKNGGVFTFTPPPEEETDGESAAAAPAH